MDVQRGLLLAHSVGFVRPWKEQKWCPLLSCLQHGSLGLGRKRDETPRPPSPCTCRVSSFPAASRSLQTCYQVSMRWAEPPSFAVFTRAGGSSSLSKFGSLHLRCAAERRRGKSSGGETWRLFRLVVVFPYWILGASLSISPPFFLGRLSIILAEMKAPSAGNF